MAWRTAATVLLTVSALILVTVLLVGPLNTIQTGFNETGDYSDNGYFDGNALLNGFAENWARMSLVAIFGLMLWGAARVVRREKTRGKRRP